MTSDGRSDLERVLSTTEAESLVRSTWEKRVLTTVALAKNVRQEAGLDFCIGATAELITSRRRQLQQIDRLVTGADDTATKAKLIEASAKLTRAVMDAIKELGRLTEVRTEMSRKSQNRNRSAAPGQQVGMGLAVTPHIETDGATVRAGSAERF